MENKICHKFLHLISSFLSFLLLWLTVATSTTFGHRIVAHDKCIDKERVALLDFKAHLQDNNGLLSTWTISKMEEDNDCCKWDGISCNNQTGHVTRLDLSNDFSKNSLRGKISPSLLNLSHLSHLILAGNLFNGTIPNFIGSMTHLSYLDISFISFSGTIPVFIGSLTQLSYLDLSVNSFSGTIPINIGSLTNLKYLDISNNNLNGTIPMLISSLNQLSYLDLSNNYLHGTIPTSIGSLTELNYLILGGNSICGRIPTSIGSLTKLTRLDLSDNYHLAGTCIPPELGNLTNLQELSLGELRSCTIETKDWLSHMSNLNKLDMGGTSLAKANKWVNVIISIKKLSYLSLWGCDLSQVAHPYSSLFANSSSSSIVTLDLVDNNLNSSMYHWLLPLTSNKLRTLRLSKNMLDGKSFGNLCSSTYLYIGYNSVVVKFPDFLNNWSGCTSIALQYLYASYSRFTGSLTDEIQMFSSLEYMHLDHNELNGPISENLWELPKLQTLDISSNYLRDAISENIGRSKLRNIDLSKNLVKSVIFEAHMSNLSYVDYIDLSSCNLGHSFPKWILNLKNLTHLNIANNRISNTIPVEFWNIWHSQLTYLNLSVNNISGEVPNLVSSFDPNYSSRIDISSNNFYGHIANVPSTSVYLDLSRNKFHGEISFLCRMSYGFLAYLDLSHNSFTGKLPDCLWRFKELEVLNLGYNNLFGRLPTSVESLVGLEVLSLYKNNFFGNLSLSLKSCTKLTFLDLGADKFTGNLPLWIGESLSRLYVLSLTSNKLLGPIPLQICQLSNLQILDLSMNNLDGTIPSCMNNLTTLVQEGFLHQQNVHSVLDPSSTLTDRGEIYFYPLYVDQKMIQWQGNIREFSTNLGLFKGIDLSGNNLSGQIPYELADLHGLIALNL